VIAVLALYRAGQDAFIPDDLRLLETLVSALGDVFHSDAPKAFSAFAK
jgi:hypothetical protein